MVAVHAKNAVTELSLGGENGLFHLADGAGAVPAGRYKLCSWKIERKGADNDNWTLAGQFWTSAHCAGRPEVFSYPASHELRKQATSTCARLVGSERLYLSQEYAFNNCSHYSERTP